MKLATALIPSLLGACRPDPEGGKKTDDTAGDSGEVAPWYEEGCILVDGAGGFAWIRDALVEAEEGSTISLCENYEHVETVVVDKSVTLMAPPTGLFTLVGYGEDVPLTIEADAVTVEGIFVQSEADAIHVDGAADVRVAAVTARYSGGWGLVASDTDGLVVDSSDFSSHPSGGVLVDSGTATIQATTLDGNSQYGIRVMGGGALTLEDSVISGTVAADGDTSAGIELKSSSADLSSNTLEDNGTYNLLMTRSEATSLGDAMTGGTFGIYGERSSLDLDQGVITDAADSAIAMLSCDDVAIRATTVSTDPAIVTTVGIDDWGTTGTGIVGTGVVLDASVQIEDLSVSGYRQGGVFIDGATGAVDGLDLDDNGWFGLFVQNSELALADVLITGVDTLGSIDDKSCANYTIINAGIVSYISTVDATSLVIEAPDGWGIASYDSDLLVDGYTVSGPMCSGLLNYQGDAELTNAVMDGTVGEYPGVFAYYAGDTVVTDSSFSGSTGEGASDVQLYYSGTNRISGCSFESGNLGVWVEGTGLTLEDSTFDGYSSAAVYQYYGTSPVTVANTRFSDFSSYAVACQLSEPLEISSSTFLDATGTGIYTYSCDSAVGDVSFSNVAAATNYSYGLHELVNATLEGMVGWSGAIYGYGLDGLTIDGLEISGVTNSYAVNMTSSPLQLSGAELSDLGSYGLYLSGGTTVLDRVSIADATSNGLYASGASLTASGLTVQSSGSYGVYARSSTLVLDGALLDSNGNAGMFLDNCTATVTNSSLTGNETFGLHCIGSTVEACDGVDFSGNGAGEELNCGIDCSTDTGGVDTGTTDTGTTDTGTTDTGTSDTGTTDTGTTDTGTTDTGPGGDTAAAETGRVDTGPGGADTAGR